jgi:hypothetical protein
VRSVEVEDGVRVSPVVGEGSLVGKRLPDLWRRRGVCRRRRGRLDSEADGWRFRGGWKWGNRGVGDCWGGVCEPGRGTREREREVLGRGVGVGSGPGLARGLLIRCCLLRGPLQQVTFFICLFYDFAKKYTTSSKFCKTNLLPSN